MEQEIRKILRCPICEKGRIADAPAGAYFSRQLFLLFLERLYFTIVLFSLAGKILLLFLLQF